MSSCEICHVVTCLWKKPPTYCIYLSPVPPSPPLWVLLSISLSTVLYLEPLWSTLLKLLPLGLQLSVTGKCKLSCLLMICRPQKYLESFSLNTQLLQDHMHLRSRNFLRYSVAETPIYKPSLQGCEPPFHICQTEWISGRSCLICVCCFLSPTHEIQLEESWLFGFYWMTPPPHPPTHTHATARLKDLQQGRGGIKLTNLSAKVELQPCNMAAWPLGCLAGASVSFMTSWGEEPVHLSPKGRIGFQRAAASSFYVI